MPRTKTCGSIPRRSARRVALVRVTMGSHLHDHRTKPTRPSRSQRDLRGKRSDGTRPFLGVPRGVCRLWRRHGAKPQLASRSSHGGRSHRCRDRALLASVQESRRRGSRAGRTGRTRTRWPAIPPGGCPDRRTRNRRRSYGSERVGTRPPTRTAPFWLAPFASST
jgi:hypothetical protein